MSDSFREMVLKNLDSFVYEHFHTETGARIKLTPYQKEFIQTVLSKKHNKYVFLASTRVGKTEACAILATLTAMLYDGEEVTIVAPVYKQAERMFMRIRTYFLSSPRLMRMIAPNKPFRRDEINIVNGSVIRCLSAANSESLLGFGATTLIVDEAGSIDDNVFRTRILRMTASAAARGVQPVVVLIGTPHRMNYFYESWNSPDFLKFRVTWEDGVKNGILKREEVEYAKKVMTQQEFSMWFEAEFVGMDESAFFDIRLVDEAMVGVKEREPKEGYIYYAGLDVARFGADESAFVIVRVPEGVSLDSTVAEMVYMSCRAKRSLTDIAGWAKTLAEKWNVKCVVVDETGLGSGVMDMLSEVLGNKVMGISFAGKERNEVYMNLKRMIEEKKLILLKDEKLRYQMTSYTYKFSREGSVSILKNPKMQDDVVDALALACYVLAKERGEEWYISEAVKEWMMV